MTNHLTTILDRNAEIVGLYENGMLVAEIAAHHSLPRWRVREILGLPAKSTKH